MPKYRIQSPDGQTWEVNAPDGATQDEVLSYAQSQWKAQQVPGDIAPNGKTRAQLEREAATLSTPAPASTRFGLGVAAPAVGLGQLASRPIAAAGRGIEAVTGPNALTQGMQNLVARNDQAAKELLAERERARSGLQGLDVAGIGGEVVGSAPLALVGGVPATTARLIGTGAATGAAAGAITPTEGGESYLGRKALDVGAGAVLGGVAAPVASSAVNLIGKAGAAAVNQLRRFGSNLTPQQVQVTIQQTLQNAGVDVSQLPQQFQDDVQREVLRALQTGGQLDEAALVNRALFQQVGAQGTRGQITQNPSQFGQELYTREQPGGEELAGQYVNTLQTLNQRLRDLEAGTAKPIRDVEAGQQVQRVLEQADARGNALVNALYGAARGTAGIDTEIPGRELAQGINKALTQQRLTQALPGDYVRFMQELGSGKPITIGTAQEEIAAINGLLKTYAGKPEGVALNIIKRQLNEAAERVGATTGEPAAAAFAAARKAASQRFAVQEAVPALRAAAQGELEPDSFMRKYVYNANLADFKKLGEFVRQASPQTWNQIRGQVLGDLQAAANPTGSAADFSQAAYNRVLRSLDESGKLETLFTKPEISQLRAVGRVGELVQKGPPGVSRTGLSGAAKAASQLSNIVGRLPVFGRLGAVAQAAGQRGGNILQAQASLRPPPVTTNALASILPQSLPNRLGALAGPAVTIPFVSE